MTEHRHAQKELWSSSHLCSCGVVVCTAVSPGGRGCNLEEGHPGPHTNTWSPEYGTWEDSKKKQEAFDKAKALMERARNAAGEDKVNAVLECQDVLMGAGICPSDLGRIDTSWEEMMRLIAEGDKECPLGPPGSL